MKTSFIFINYKAPNYNPNGLNKSLRMDVTRENFKRQQTSLIDDFSKVTLPAPHQSGSDIQNDEKNCQTLGIQKWDRWKKKQRIFFPKSSFESRWSVKGDGWRVRPVSNYALCMLCNQTSKFVAKLLSSPDELSNTLKL